MKKLISLLLMLLMVLTLSCALADEPTAEPTSAPTAAPTATVEPTEPTNSPAPAEEGNDLLMDGVAVCVFGLGGVFLVLILFYLTIKGIQKIPEPKESEE